MTALAQTLFVNLLVVCATLTLLWLLSIVCRDASIIDPFWGAGFVIAAWLSLGWNPTTDPRCLLLLGLTTLWGLRLSIFLLLRNWGHGEDRRYAVMRSHHGQRFVWVSLFTVFLLQGLILWFVSMPIQVAFGGGQAAKLHWFDVTGMSFWSIGFCLETLGDWQLARFKADPRNASRVMDRGLWRFTRHPNYFGDFCVWWGLYLLSIPSGAWWTVGSPLLMSVLLMRVSGVTLLESTITDRRPEYAEYKSRTNAFFPGLPKPR